MTAHEKRAAGMIGYDQASWDAGDAVSTTTHPWNQLLTGEREAATFLGYSQAEWDAELQVADVAPPASVATQPQPAASSAAYPPPLAPVVGNANGAGAWATVSTSKRPASKPPPVVHPSAGPTPTMALDGVTKFTSGMMFGCKKDTYDENMQRMLFGLPEHHFKIAQNINDTTGLFLFNYSTKQLHGIFVRNGPAGLNLEPEAWKHHRKPGDSPNRSPYPAQVRWKEWKKCRPIREDLWRHVPNVKGGGGNRPPIYEMWLTGPQAQELAKLCLRHG